MSDLVPVNPRVVFPHELREDRKSRRRLEAERADKEYLAELRRRYLKRIEEESRQFELYQLGRPTEPARPLRRSSTFVPAMATALRLTAAGR